VPKNPPKRKHWKLRLQYHTCQDERKILQNLS
jgi:hypothetical protein